MFRHLLTHYILFLHNILNTVQNIKMLIALKLYVSSVLFEVANLMNESMNSF